MYILALLRDSVCAVTHMVDVAQSVEHLIVVQEVAGSKPVVHPVEALQPQRLQGFLFLAIHISADYDHYMFVSFAKLKSIRRAQNTLVPPAFGS